MSLSIQANNNATKHNSSHHATEVINDSQKNKRESDFDATLKLRNIGEGGIESKCDKTRMLNESNLTRNQDSEV